MPLETGKSAGNCLSMRFNPDLALEILLRRKTQNRFGGLEREGRGSEAVPLLRLKATVSQARPSLFQSPNAINGFKGG